ncbi:MAG: leucyl aminopeptidase family protein [Pseudomonadota bacterium]
MTDLLLNRTRRKATPIHMVTEDAVNAFLRSLPKPQSAWIKTQGFAGKAGSHVAVPGEKGEVALVVFGAGAPSQKADPFLPSKLVSALPEGTYAFVEPVEDGELIALGWLMEAYRFDAYTTTSVPSAKLVAPKGVDADAVRAKAEAVTLTRNLINTPANDMGPDALEAAIRALAKTHSAKVSSIVGNQLLKQNFPMIHAVGRASDIAPRLVDMTWGAASRPKVTLVGKGVCFDTGGLNLKPGNSMALMKKDMGGAANVLGLASMIMQAKLPVRLRVLIPAVENSVSAGAFRPGDILPSRKGLSVEIGNTDAEGRLVLADALHLADEEKPDLLIDMATLTGAARVAVGPDLAPFYTDDEELAGAISQAGANTNDPVWRMPFWSPYDEWLSSSVADVNHISSGGFAGSITASLFLRRFVENARSYVHLDIFGWTPKAKPGRPMGGEACAIRALFEVIETRYTSRRTRRR